MKRLKLRGRTSASPDAAGLEDVEIRVVERSDSPSAELEKKSDAHM